MSSRSFSKGDDKHILLPCIHYEQFHHPESFFWLSRTRTHIPTVNQTPAERAENSLACLPLLPSCVHSIR